MWIVDCGALKSRYINMRIPMILSTFPALALVITFSPLEATQASTFVTPGLRAQADSLIHTIARKKLKPKNAKYTSPNAKTTKTKSIGG